MANLSRLGESFVLIAANGGLMLSKKKWNRDYHPSRKEIKIGVSFIQVLETLYQNVDKVGDAGVW